ncbi:hypothetical protein Trydic_g3426, partial [Trypoxylus dichotomus]
GINYSFIKALPNSSIAIKCIEEVSLQIRSTMAS